jgi:hypothetical protein
MLLNFDTNQPQFMSPRKTKKPNCRISKMNCFFRSFIQLFIPSFFSKAFFSKARKELLKSLFLAKKKKALLSKGFPFQSGLGTKPSFIVKSLFSDRFNKSNSNHQEK